MRATLIGSNLGSVVDALERDAVYIPRMPKAAAYRKSRRCRGRLVKFGHTPQVPFPRTSGARIRPNICTPVLSPGTEDVDIITRIEFFISQNGRELCACDISGNLINGASLYEIIHSS